jgi:hypothetical protein
MKIERAAASNPEGCSVQLTLLFPGGLYDWAKQAEGATLGMWMSGVRTFWILGLRLGGKIHVDRVVECEEAWVGRQKGGRGAKAGLRLPGDTAARLQKRCHVELEMRPRLPLWLTINFEALGHQRDGRREYSHALPTAQHRLPGLHLWLCPPSQGPRRA